MKIIQDTKNCSLQTHIHCIEVNEKKNYNAFIKKKKLKIGRYNKRRPLFQKAIQVNREHKTILIKKV